MQVCMCMRSAFSSQKRASDLLKRELQMVLSYHVVLGTEFGFSARAACDLNC